MKEDDRYIRTPDRYLAAFLLLHGAELANVDSLTSTQGIFVFVPTPRTLTALHDWHRPEPTYVEVRSYRDAIKIINSKANAKEFNG